jgi:hypothetical protein
VFVLQQATKKWQLASFDAFDELTPRKTVDLNENQTASRGRAFGHREVEKAREQVATIELSAEGDADSTCHVQFPESLLFTIIAGFRLNVASSPARV